MHPLLLFVSALLLSSAIPSFAAPLYPVPKNSPQGKSLCNLLIEPAGYTCTEYTVETKDGYLLGVQRVGARNGNLTQPRGPPVFLQHGLFMAGDAWFLGTREQSLGFILADQGFDVWVGSVRGTYWSHGHISLSDRTKEFWDWSWQQLAEYDLPAMLKHVYTTTKSKIYYVGHSQGTLMPFVALEQPDVAEMIGAAALLCPVAHIGRVTSPIVRKMLELRIDESIQAQGMPQLNFRSDESKKLFDSVCKPPVDCSDFVSQITGKNCCLNQSSISHILEFEPQPTSTKNLIHFFQMTRFNTVAKFDYGTNKNMWRYGGSPKPPVYDLGLVSKSVPLFIGYGGQDHLVAVADVEQDLRELPTKPKLLYLENYGHLDFILSTRGKEDVYDHVIDFFRSLEKSNGSRLPETSGR